MMYNEKLAVAIKSNGKILREFKDKVYIKFGSEYSVYIKNLNNVRVQVKVYIDGVNVTPDSLVINANSEVDLERSLLNKNLNAGNKFKFIERTSAIEDHRGIKLEDGIIRVEYQFERPYVHATFGSAGLGTGVFPCNDWNSIIYGSGVLRNSSTATYSANSIQTSNTMANSVDGGVGAVSANVADVQGQYYNDAGITVPGSKSEQKFTTVASFPLDWQTHCIVLNLLGETPDNKPVIKTVTVKHKQKCTSCGSQNKSHAKFCNKCGTALELF